MSKITFEEYKSAIRRKYVVQKTEEVSGILLNPTPAQLRNLCLMGFEGSLNTADENIFKIFFKVQEAGSLRKAIENFDLGKFKPLISFLKEEKDSDHVVRIELAAILVDFRPRPYAKYLHSSETEMNKCLGATATEKGIMYNGKRSQEESKEKRMIGTYNKRLGKRVGIGSLVLISLFFLGYTVRGIFFSRKGCMQWNKNHYEEVDCSVNQLGPGQFNAVFPVDEEVMSLKKLESRNKLIFFKNDRPTVWYSKIDGKVILFNGPGFHPETGKPLKPITKYIIKKYNLEKD